MDKSKPTMTFNTVIPSPAVTELEVKKFKPNKLVQTKNDAC